MATKPRKQTATLPRHYRFNREIKTNKRAFHNDLLPQDSLRALLLTQTTTDGNIVNSDYLSIKENTYVDGQGKMVVCGKLEALPSRAFYDNSTLATITIPDSVTHIGDDAFFSCDLTSVSIPNSVTYIGDSAFSFCDLTSVTIPDSVTYIGDSAFFECYNLSNVTLGNSVTHIGYRAFYSCDIASITIPNSVTHIGEKAFSGCDFSTVTIPDSVTYIGTQAFDMWGLKEFKGKFASADGRCLIQDETLIAYANGSGPEYIIPESATKIGAYAFYNNSLESITLHENITEIGTEAFYSYNDIDSRIYLMSYEPPYLDGYSIFCTDNYNFKIFVPKEYENRYKSDYYWRDYAMLIYPYDYNRVQANNEIWYTSEGDAIVEPNNRNAFGNANIISNSYQNGRCIISFDKDITEIGYEAFWDCDGLTSVTIPEGVTSIGNYAFWNCYGLTSVIIPEGVTSIGNYAFLYCRKLSSITIPDSVVEFGDGIFRSCSDLSEFKGNFAEDNGRILVVDGKLVSIAPAGLSEYTIPSSVTSIGNEAFLDCDGLTSVTIPEGVTSIGNSAFAYCDGLTSVYSNAIIPPTLGSWALDNSPASIYVPMESVGAYKSAKGWNVYADAIVGYDF